MNQTVPVQTQGGGTLALGYFLPGFQPFDSRQGGLIKTVAAQERGLQTASTFISTSLLKRRERRAPPKVPIRHDIS